jgi:hypothetical protein
MTVGFFGCRDARRGERLSQFGSAFDTTPPQPEKRPGENNLTALSGQVSLSHRGKEIRTQMSDFARVSVAFRNGNSDSKFEIRPSVACGEGYRGKGSTLNV